MPLVYAENDQELSVSVSIFRTHMRNVRRRYASSLVPSALKSLLEVQDTWQRRPSMTQQVQYLSWLHEVYAHLDYSHNYRFGEQEYICRASNCQKCFATFVNRCLLSKVLFFSQRSRIFPLRVDTDSSGVWPNESEEKVKLTYYISAP